MIIIAKRAGRNINYLQLIGAKAALALSAQQLRLGPYKCFAGIRLVWMTQRLSYYQNPFLLRTLVMGVISPCNVGVIRPAASMSKDVLEITAVTEPDNRALCNHRISCLSSL